MDENDKIPFDIKSTVKDDIVYVEATGKRDLETVLEITKRTIDIAIAKNLHKALVDVRKLEGKLRTSDSFSIPVEHFEKLRYRTALQQAAVVDLKENIEAYSFFENVAVNRGYRLRFFNSVEEALEWLKKSSDLA